MSDPVARHPLTALVGVLSSLGRETNDLLTYGQSRKAVETAVGPKHSCLHFQALEAPGIYRVTADYGSEGRNILACVSTVLDMNYAAQWQPSITDVCRIVDDAVDQSYARRVWISRQMASEANTAESVQTREENRHHEP